MTDLLPRATARGPVLARVVACHAMVGRSIDGPLRWAIGLAAAVAIAHAVIFGVAFTILLWERPVALPSQVLYLVFWLFFAGIAAGIHLLLTFVVTLPLALAGRLLAAAPGPGAVGGAVATAAALLVFQPVVAWSWLTTAGLHEVPIESLTAASALAGLLWGSWLPRLRSGRA